MNPDAPAPAARPFRRSSDALDFPSPQNSIVPNPPPVIPDHEMIRLIGHGSYGQVWLAKNVVGTLRAVKVVYRATFDETKEMGELCRFVCRKDRSTPSLHGTAC